MGALNTLKDWRSPAYVIWGRKTSQLWFPVTEVLSEQAQKWNNTGIHKDQWSWHCSESICTRAQKNGGKTMHSALLLCQRKTLVVPWIIWAGNVLLQERRGLRGKEVCLRTLFKDDYPSSPHNVNLSLHCSIWMCIHQESIRALCFSIREEDKD